MSCAFYGVCLSVPSVSPITPRHVHTQTLHTHVVCSLVAKKVFCGSEYPHTYRADSRLAPSQWETALLYNVISHWLGANWNQPYLCVACFWWAGYHYKDVPMGLMASILYDDARLIGIGIPILNLRQSPDCLRFIMGIPIPIRWCVLMNKGQGVFLYTWQGALISFPWDLNGSEYMILWHGKTSAWLSLYEGNLRVTGGFPSQRDRNAELWCFLSVCPNKMFDKQSSCQWFQMPWSSCNVAVMMYGCQAVF